MHRVKIAFYILSKWFGMFSVARAVTKSGLRILCYHGFALSDEDAFAPKLFMKPETFKKRMAYLRKHDYTVLPLEQACELLSTGMLPKRAVAITIDDGFYSVFRCAWPVLVEHKLPATVYVTSYYALKENPVFRLVVQYMFWKTKRQHLDLSGLHIPLTKSVAVANREERERAVWEIIGYGELHCDEERRCELLRELGGRTGVDFEQLRQKRNLSLMNAFEIQTAAAGGADIQLHTHRHRLNEDASLVEREIAQNREFLQPLVSSKLSHLCYPSGIWSRQFWSWLQALDIKTATTCDPGLNYRSTPLLGLKRFLDGENISSIEFEAELAGFAELLRRTRSLLFRPFRASALT